MYYVDEDVESLKEVGESENGDGERGNEEAR